MNTTTIDDIIFKNNSKKVYVKTGETMEDTYHDDKPFLSKQLVFIEDQNNSVNYGSNQVKFNSKNLGSMCDFPNSVFAIPKVTILYRNRANKANALGLIADADISKQVAFKPGHYHDFDSVKINYGTDTTIQQRNNIGAYISYRHNTEMNENDLQLNGAITGDYKIGNDYDFDNKNGFSTKRTSADLKLPYSFVSHDGVAGKSQIISQDNIENYGYDYYEKMPYTNAAGEDDVEYVYYSTDFIRARDIPFLQDMVMCKGSDIEITFTLNQTETIVTVAAGAKTAISNNLRGSTNPLLRTNEEVPAASDYTEHLSWKAVSHKSYIKENTIYEHKMKYCRWYIPTYIMNPEALETYLTLGTRKIVFEDVIAKEIVDVNGAFSETLSSSVANVKKLIIVPVFNKTSIGNKLNGLQNDNAQRCMYSSSPATCCPVMIENLNVKMAGVPVYTDSLTYGFENFLKEMDGSQGIFGNLNTGIVSGLVGKQEFENNYNYYVVDLSRRSVVDNDKGFQVHLQGTIKSPAKVDLICYLVVKREAIIDLATGLLVGNSK
jgi:hypothetical protein